MMRRTDWVRYAAVAATSLAAAGGCGGTSSETPWPVEPDDVDLGPNADKPPDERSLAKPNAAVAAPPEDAEPATTDPVDETEAP